jgi:Flp pilus assembly protein TadD
MGLGVLANRLLACLTVWAIVSHGNLRSAHAEDIGRPNSASEKPALSGKYAAYDAAFRQTLQKPSDPKVLATFAAIAVEIGDLEGAISALERLLLINGDLPDVKLELGVLYFRLGSFETARVYLRSALASPTATQHVKDRANRFLKAKTKT